MNIFISVIPFFISLAQNGFVDAFQLRITGGRKAALNEFPFLVSFQRISKSNRHFCGGTLIDDNWIITAAHCVPGQDFNDIRIVAGITNLKSKIKEANIRKIDQVFRNPNFNKPLPKDNDVALVKLNTPYKLDKFINKAQLAAGNYHVPKDQTVYVVGWGVEKIESETPSDNLKKAKVQALQHSHCAELYKDKVKVGDKVFCTAHNGKNNKGSCSGDSGGPVLKDKKILVGVISSNYSRVKCGDKNHPDIHSQVAKFREWIDSTISGNGN